MARDPEDIEREIEKARNSLATTLDELGERANPQRLVDSGKESLRHRLADPKVRYALIAAGAAVGLLVLRKIIR